MKVGDFIIDKHDGKRKKIMSKSGSLYFIGRDREPVRSSEIKAIPQKRKTAKKPQRQKRKQRRNGKPLNAKNNVPNSATFTIFFLN